MNPPDHPRTAALSLSGSLCVSEAEATRERLLEALAATPELHIDLAGVEALDASGVQLLWAVRVAAQRAGKHIDFENTPPVVREHWSALGIPDECFGPATITTP